MKMFPSEREKVENFLCMTLSLTYFEVWNKIEAGFLNSAIYVYLCKIENVCLHQRIKFQFPRVTENANDLPNRKEKKEGKKNCKNSFSSFG